MYESTIFSSEMFDQAKKYWLDKLSGELTELNFSGDYPGKLQNAETNYKIVFDNQVTEKLIHISKNNDLSLYVILLTSFKILLYKFTGQADIIVSSSTLNNSEQSYNKCIALRDVLNPEMTFKDFLLIVKETVVEGYKNQYYPIRKLIKLLNIENTPSLFKVVLLLNRIHNRDFLKEALEDFDNDMIFLIERIGKTNEDNQTLQGEITYNSRLFEKETIQKFVEGYFYLLTQVLDNTNIKISDIKIITEEEKKQVLIDFNRTKVEYPRDRTIQRLFEEQAEKKPGKLAVVDGDRFLTYGELDKKAYQLACQLGDKGVAAETIVGMMVKPSLEMMVTLLGILKAGGAYLPLDPDYPPESLKYILKDSRSPVLITQGNVKSKLEEISLELEVIDDLDRDIYTGNEDISACINTPAGLAYVIYTSGSTGKPKGVMVEHGNVARLVKNSNIIDFKDDDRLLLTGIVVFDITTFEIWAPLLNGFTIFLVDQNVILDAKNLKKTIAQYGISILHLIPQLLIQLASDDIDLFTGLDYLLVGGDTVRPQHINEVRNKHQNMKIIHMYGPTENTTFSSCFSIDKDYEIKIPIGKPIGNSTVYILDKNRALAPLGAVGELALGGEGLTRGYLNNPTLTKEKFVENPFVPGERIYMSGDLGRWISNGDIEFIGRQDQQVKVGGIRIELGEIESQLLTHENIDEAIVMAVKNDNGDSKHLCAYIVSKSELVVSQVREKLARQLPDYMIPSYFVQVDKIPVTTNGKVDKKALLTMDGRLLKVNVTYVEPRNENEKLMADLCKEIFKVDKIGLDDNFFDLGANSFSIIQLNGKLKETFETDISVLKLFEFPTIASFLEYMDLNGSAVDIGDTEAEQGEPMDRNKDRLARLRNIRMEVD